MYNIDYFLNNFDKSIDFDIFKGIFFFLTFARFEYALKQSGFLQNGRDAKPDWETYANTIESDMQSRIHNISDSLNYFRDNPTKKQENDNGTLRYVETPFTNQCSEFVWAIRMIRRVRNNFFHGGKYRDLVVEDSLRNSTLLNHSLLVLNECLYLENEVTRHFFNF